MQTFGSLVKALRKARGLSQDDLAALAGVDRGSISRVEQHRGGIWHPSTARLIFEKLDESATLSEHHAHEYLRLAGLDPSLAARKDRSRLALDVAAEDAGKPVPSDATSIEMRQVYRALASLLDALGPAQATEAMDALVAARKPARPTQPTQELTLIDPPKVPFPGAIEQVHRTYEVHTPKPAPKPKAKPKKRTG